MIDFDLILAVAAGIGLLFLLILYFKVQAFVALLICSIAVGLFAGLPPAKIVESIQNGMASTLGFVAVIVGLGALFGAILQHSGGVEALATAILNKTGEKKATWALVATGFIISIPVFFDVGFIILVPVVYALQKKTSKSLLLYALPLLAGLAVSHAFIPPTPGPVVVADILGANLSTVMLTGMIAGIPAAIIAGPVFGRFLSKRIQVSAPENLPTIDGSKKLPGASLVAFLIILPLSLILLNTFFTSPLLKGFTGSSLVEYWLPLVGHPFMALLIANLLAWYLLGIRERYNKSELLEISTSSLAPAGLIILITGAGGVFKEMLTVTGAGKMIALSMEQYHLPGVLFGFGTAWSYVSCKALRRWP